MSGSLTIGGIAAANQALEVSGRADFLSNITVAADLAVATDTLFVDASQETVGINAGTSLTAGLSLDIKGGSKAAFLDFKELEDLITYIWILEMIIKMMEVMYGFGLVMVIVAVLSQEKVVT